MLRPQSTLKKLHSLPLQEYETNCDTYKGTLEEDNGPTSAQKLNTSSLADSVQKQVHKVLILGWTLVITKTNQDGLHFTVQCFTVSPPNPYFNLLCITFYTFSAMPIFSGLQYM